MSYKIPCTVCGGTNYCCVDSRPSRHAGVACRRVHECMECKNRVYTHEVLVTSDDSDIKNDNFSRAKGFKEDLEKMLDENIRGLIDKYFPTQTGFLQPSVRGGRPQLRKKSTADARVKADNPFDVEAFMLTTKKFMKSKGLKRGYKACPACGGRWIFQIDNEGHVKGECNGPCGRKGIAA